MTSDELFFFNTKPDALPLYAALAERMLAAFPNVTVEVKKTQITFRERYGFAFVSLRKMKGCPEVFIIVSFGLSHRLDSPRIHMAVEPYPNRWTHHVIVASVEEINGELMGWLIEAHDFALVKLRGIQLPFGGITTVGIGAKVPQIAHKTLPKPSHIF